jgi:hypothetical protein
MSTSTRTRPATTRAPSTAEGWRSLVVDLDGQLAELRGRAEASRSSKGAIALRAATGDGAARQALQAANAELSRLALEVEDLELALAGARTALADAEEAEARELERRRRRELRDLARARLALAGDVEAAIGALADRLAEVQDLTARLYGLGLPDAEAAGADRWRHQIGDLLLREVEARGARLILDRARPAPAGEGVADLLGIGACDLVDDLAD